MWTVDSEINEELSDQWVKYRTLRFDDLVRGQIIANVADAVCEALNRQHVSGYAT